MDEIKIFESPAFGKIRTAGTSESPLFCLADVCRVLELQVTPTKNRLNSDGVNLIKVIDSMGREQDATFINEANLYKAILRSDKPMAEPFQDWVCGDVLPSIRKTGSYAVQPKPKDKVDAGLAWVEGCRRLLNLSDASTLLLMEAVARPLGLPVPDYVTSKGVTHSASELLKRNGAGLSVVKFNERLVELGFLREETRQGREKRHKFKVITGKGLEYGENVVSPKSQQETQPHWYDGRFAELLDLIKNKK